MVAEKSIVCRRSAMQMAKIRNQKAAELKVCSRLCSYLPSAWAELDQFFHLVLEPEIEQPVSLVQDQDL
jgi:hypothetical protein